MAYVQRLNSRSPFYRRVDAAAYILTATLSLRIWSGHEVDDRPASATYTIAKNALTATSLEITFEFSQLIRDEFNHNRDAYDDTLSGFIDTLWVESKVVVTTSGSSQLYTTDLVLAVDGYGYFVDGINYAGTNFFTNVINNPIDKPIKLGLFAGESDDGVDTVKYYNGSVLIETDDLSSAYSSAESYDKNQYVSIIQNQIDSFKARVLADSGTYQVNTCFNTFAEAVSDNTIDTIDLIRDSVVLETITVNNIEECKYTYNTIKFYDRNGLLQQIYMFKASREKIKISKDNYNSSLYQPSTETYSVEKHQIKDYNVNGRESISLNSGWVGEEQEDVLRQVLLSEFVWVDDKPASVATSNLDYKKHINDSLINYTIDFDYANNVINDVY